MNMMLPVPVEEKMETVEGEIIDGAFFILEPNPFKRTSRMIIDGLPEDAKLDAYAERAKAELPARFRNHLEIMIGEEVIDPKYWGQVTPKAEHLVYIRAVPRGKSAKNILRVVLMVAIVAAAFYFLGPEAAIFAKGGLFAGVSGFGAALLSATLVAGATFLGMMAVNALIPAPGITAEPNSRDPRYTLTGSSNRFVPYGKIPRPMGEIRMYPMLAGQPYTEIVGKDQYLRMLLVVGWGPLDISDIKIGDTAIGSFVGASWEVTEGGPAGWGGNQALSLYNRDVTETGLNIETLYNVPSAIQTTPVNTVEISVDISFPQGLIEWTKKSKKMARTVEHRVEYRAVGSGTWLQPSWETDYTGRSISGGRLKATGTTQDVYRLSGRWKVAAGQYEVRVTRLTTAGVIDSSPQIDQSYWTAIRSFADSEPVTIQDGLCMIALRLKATDQLNGVPDRINCIAKSYLPVTSDGGQNWTYTITRNPAWVYTDLLRRRGGETFIADSRIDIAAMEAWAAANDVTAPNASEPRWTFDAVLEGGSVFDNLRQVASIGRAAFTYKDGLYSVVRDVSQATPVQHITPRNSWGYSGSKMFVDLPHALKVEFQNRDELYRMDERYVYADGYTEANATKFEVLQLFGATSPTLVFREARYHLAVGQLRPEEHQVSMDIEALRCHIGARVELSHDVIVTGTGFGRVRALSTSGADTIGVELDSPVTFETGKTYQLRVRHKDGSSSIRTVTSPGAALGEFADVEFAAETTAGGIEVGDLFMFGETSLVTAPMIVKRIEPGDDLSCVLTLIPYDEAIYTADTGTIPAFTSYMSSLPENTPPPTPIIQLRSDDTALDIMSDGTVLTRIAVDLLAGSGGTVGTEAFEVQYHEYDSLEPSIEDWTDAGQWPASTSTVWIYEVRDAADYVVRARARGTNGLYSDWVELAAHTVIGKTNAPEQPTSPALIASYRSISVSWTDPQDLDLAPTEVWASQTNNFAGATMVGRSGVGAFLHDNLAADGLPWYYWIVAVDLFGNAATEVAAGNATALTIADYEGIGDDGTLTPQEKLSIIREKADLDAEEADIVDAATQAGVSSTTYTTALASLTSYLGGLSPAWNDTTQSTTIVRSTWNTNWSAVYSAREALLSDVANANGSTADWDGVTGDGKPDDGATSGQALNRGAAMDDLDKWFASTGATKLSTNADYSVQTLTDAPLGTSAFRLVDNNDDSDSMFSESVPLDPLKTYRVSVWARQPSGDRRNYLAVAFLDNAGANITAGGSGITGWTSLGTYAYWKIANTTFPTGFTKYEFTFGINGDGSVPAAAKFFRIGGLFSRDGAVGTNTTIELVGFKVEEVAPTVFYSTTEPTNAIRGDVWIDTDASPITLYRYNGSSWDAVATFGANWSTDVINRPAELTDGRVSAGLDASGDLNRDIPIARLDSSDVLRRTSGGLYTGDLAATVGADWTVNTSNRPPELTDGRVAAALAATTGVINTDRVVTDSVLADAISERTNANPGSGVTLSGTTQTIIDFTLPVELAGEPQIFNGFLDSNDQTIEGSNTTICLTVEQLTTGGSLVSTIINNKRLPSINDEGTSGGFQTHFTFNSTPTSTNRRYRIRARQVDSSSSLITTTSFVQCEALKR